VPDPKASYDSHLWMIISDPGNHPDKVVIVNFTSWADWKDQACVVDVGEHPYVHKKTCVNYAGAKIVTLDQLKTLEQAGRLKMHSHLSEALLRRIRQGVLDSRMKMSLAELLLEQGVIEDF
jgi:hypothetical protein